MKLYLTIVFTAILTLSGYSQLTPAQQHNLDMINNARIPSKGTPGYIDTSRITDVDIQAILQRNKELEQKLKDSYNLINKLNTKIYTLTNPNATQPATQPSTQPATQPKFN